MSAGKTGGSLSIELGRFFFSFVIYLFIFLVLLFDDAF